MIDVRLPDGRIITVDTDDPKAAAEAARKFAASPPPTPDAAAPDGGLGDTTLGASVPQGDDSANVLRSFLGQGVALGFGDEIEAFVRSRVNGTNLDNELSKVREEIRTFREQNPGAAAGLELAGAFTSALIPGGAVAQGATRSAQVARGASAGAAIGGAAGFGSGEGVEDRLTGAAIGAGLGAAGGAAAPALSKTVANDVPSLVALKDAAKAAFGRAEAKGAVISPDAFIRLVGGIAKDVRRIDRDVHPKAFAALRRLTEKAQTKTPVTFDDFQNLRSLAKDASGAIDKADAELASRVVGKMDEFMDTLSASQLAKPTNGSVKQVAKDLREGRELWRRFRNGELIAETFRRAELNAPNFSGSGLENALRTEFRALAKNTKKLRSFKKDEIAAIEKVAKGGTFENVARQIGKAAPTGIVSTGIGGGAGLALGGPVGAATVLAGGAAGRSLATRLTLSNSRLVDDLVRGGRLPKQPRGSRGLNALGIAAPTLANK